jgi:hydrogenase expression/formation protein HypD
MPTVVAGFEPLDLLFAVYMILKQLDEGKPALENEYSRAVRPEGNLKAQKLMQGTFETVDGRWRGLGTIASSKSRLREEHTVYDAHVKYSLRIEDGVDLQPGCRCHLVVIGKIRPTECTLFMRECTPQKPVGACMVSTEGTCQIWARTTNIGSGVRNQKML